MTRDLEPLGDEPFNGVEPDILSFQGLTNTELHCRYVGHHDGRHFVVNVQLSIADEITGEQLKPEDHRGAVANVLNAIVRAAGIEQ